jgi:hypothetical protein
VGASQRRKGASAELEVAALLQIWWRALEPGGVFKRTPASGGWAHGEARRDFKTSGDLVTSAKRFPFVVEVKRREEWHLGNFVDGKRSPVWAWWLQAQSQAKEQGGVPMLWLRKSNMTWMVVAPAGTLPFAGWASGWKGRWPRSRGARAEHFRAGELLIVGPETLLSHLANLRLAEWMKGGAK